MNWTLKVLWDIAGLEGTLLGQEKVSKPTEAQESTVCLVNALCEAGKRIWNQAVKGF